MNECYKCKYPSDGFIHDERNGQVVCSKCGYVQAAIQDETLETRLFNDAKSSQKKDRHGTMINKKSSDDKARLEVQRLCAQFNIEPGKGMYAISVYKEYQLATSPHKTLRSRPLPVVIAACLYCSLCQTDTGVDIELYPKLRLKLEEYCENKGRNTKTSAFEQQLKDILKYIKFENMKSVEKYIQEVRLRLNWPNYVTRGVLNLKKVFQHVEDEVLGQQKMNIQQYTAMLFYMITMSFEYNGKSYKGFMQDQKEKICQFLIVDEGWIKQEISQIFDEQKNYIAQIYQKVSEEKQIDE